MAQLPALDIWDPEIPGVPEQLDAHNYACFWWEVRVVVTSPPLLQLRGWDGGSWGRKANTEGLLAGGQQQCAGLRAEKGRWAHPRSLRGFLCRAWAGRPREGDTPGPHGSRWRWLGLLVASCCLSQELRFCAFPAQKGALVWRVELEVRDTPRLAVAPWSHGRVTSTVLGT